jgi:hypothetical protein
LIEEGRKLLILDVRRTELRAQEGIIPGAVAASADNIDTVCDELSASFTDSGLLRVPKRGIGSDRGQTFAAGRV